MGPWAAAGIMAFNKFEPHREEEEGHGASSDTAHRRAMLLKYGWWISLIYTAFGFVMIGYFMVR